MFYLPTTVFTRGKTRLRVILTTTTKISNFCKPKNGVDANKGPWSRETQRYHVRLHSDVIESQMAISNVTFSPKVLSHKFYFWLCSIVKNTLGKKLKVFFHLCFFVKYRIRCNFLWLSHHAQWSYWTAEENYYGLSWFLQEEIYDVTTKTRERTFGT